MRFCFILEEEYRRGAVIRIAEYILHAAKKAEVRREMRVGRKVSLQATTENMLRLAQESTRPPMQAVGSLG